MKRVLWTDNKECIWLKLEYQTTFTVTATTTHFAQYVQQITKSVAISSQASLRPAL